MNKKQVNVVMLYTKEAKRGDGHIWKGSLSNHLSLYSIAQNGEQYLPQHLYFTDDSEIKEGDWVYNSNTKEIGQNIGKNFHSLTTPDTFWLSIRNKNSFDSKFCSKIIAATDSKLSLPFIPVKWIEEKYIPSQGKIDKVWIELDSDLSSSDMEEYSITSKYPTNPKLSKDGEVIIVNGKESYTKEDMRKSFEAGWWKRFYENSNYNNGYDREYSKYDKRADLTFEQWFEQNL